MTQPVLPFHVITAEESSAAQKDPTWHRIHSFVHGYGWRRGDGAAVYDAEFEDPAALAALTDAEKDTLWPQVQAVHAKRPKRPLPTELPKEIALPRINAPFPSVPLTDLISEGPDKP